MGILDFLINEIPYIKKFIIFFRSRYVDKLTEFLRTFVTSHLGRFEGSARFPVMEFLSLLFKYTFLQQRVESYFACLDAWATVVDFVTNALVTGKSGGKLVESPGSSASAVSPGTAGSVKLLARYHEALLALTTEVLARMQFRIDHVSRTMIEDLDNSSLDDDVSSCCCYKCQIIGAGAESPTPESPAPDSPAPKSPTSKSLV